MVTNAQRASRVNVARMRRLAACAGRVLRITTRGTLVVSLIEARRMRALNRRFLGHDRPTDVLTFRYDGRTRSHGRAPQDTTVGEVVIAPSAARGYARAHRGSYEEELARYVVHGMLHWLGHEDRTARQQARMRRREDWVLSACGVMRGKGQAGGTAASTRAPRPVPHAP